MPTAALASSGTVCDVPVAVLVARSTAGASVVAMRLAVAAADVPVVAAGGIGGPGGECVAAGAPDEQVGSDAGSLRHPGAHVGAQPVPD